MYRLAIDEVTELRPLEPRHAEEVFAAVNHDRAMLREWLPWVDAARAARDTEVFLEGQMQKLARQEELTIGIWRDNRFSGAIGVIFKTDAPTAEIGYWLRAAAQGHGVMTRALRAVLQHLFQDLEINRVEIHSSPENARSCAVAERLGFVKEGLMREAQLLHGRYLDHCLYAMLRKDWQAET